MESRFRQSPKKQILITGNGFDLALGLPTSYIEFIRAAHKAISSPNGHIEVSEVFPEKFETLNTYYKLQTSYDLSKIKRHNENAWLRYFMAANPPEAQLNIEIKWVDFEKEIRQILEDVAHLKREIEQVEKQVKGRHDHILRGSQHSGGNPVPLDERSFDRLHKILHWSSGSNITFVSLCNEKFKTPTEILEYLYEELKEFSKIFKTYLELLIVPIFKSKKFQKPLIAIPTEVITFNYTPIASLLEFKCSYLHGQIDNDIIFGIDSAEGLTEDLGPHALSFTKYFQCLFHHTFATEFKQSTLLDSHQNDYYFYGHSFDLSDRSYIELVFKALANNPSQKATIYYHSEESRSSILRNLLDEKMLGEGAQQTVEKLVAHKRLVFEFKKSILPSLS